MLRNPELTAESPYKSPREFVKMHARFVLYFLRMHSSEIFSPASSDFFREKIYKIMDQFMKYQMLLRAEEFAKNDLKNEKQLFKELLQIKKDTGNTNVDDSITISKLKLKAYLTFLKRDKDALIKVKEEFKIFMSDTLSNFMESTDTVCCVLYLSTSSTKNDYIGTKQNENVRRLAKQLKL